MFIAVISSLSWGLSSALILLFCGNFGGEYSLSERIKICESECILVKGSWRVLIWKNFTFFQVRSNENINRFILHFDVFFEKKTIVQNIWRRFHGKLFNLRNFFLCIPLKEVIPSSDIEYHLFWKYYRVTYRKREGGPKKGRFSGGGAKNDLWKPKQICLIKARCL